MAKQGLPLEKWRFDCLYVQCQVEKNHQQPLMLKESFLDVLALSRSLYEDFTLPVQHYLLGSSTYILSAFGCVISQHSMFILAPGQVVGFSGKNMISGVKEIWFSI